MSEGFLSTKLDEKSIRLKSRLAHSYLKMVAFLSVLRLLGGLDLFRLTWMRLLEGLTFLRMRSGVVLKIWRTEYGIYSIGQGITRLFNIAFMKCACMAQDVRKLFRWKGEIFLYSARQELQIICWRWKRRRKKSSYQQ